jgi:hypothetical protein
MSARVKMGVSGLPMTRLVMISIPAPTTTASQVMAVPTTTMTATVAQTNPSGVAWKELVSAFPNAKARNVGTIPAQVSVDNALITGGVKRAPVSATAGMVNVIQRKPVPPVLSTVESAVETASATPSKAVRNVRKTVETAALIHYVQTMKTAFSARTIAEPAL